MKKWINLKIYLFQTLEYNLINQLTIKYNSRYTMFGSFFEYTILFGIIG